MERDWHAAGRGRHTSQADDPALHACGWIEDLICRETTAGAIEIIAGKARKQFLRLLPERAEGPRKNYHLKAVNPSAKGNEDTRTPDELLDVIEAKGREVAEALAALRAMGRPDFGVPNRSG